MFIDPILRQDIQNAERCVLTAYKDTEGYWTVGWGHRLPLDHDWTGYTVTQDFADRTLSSDLLVGVSDSSTLVECVNCDTRARRNALSELVFNMGLPRWKGTPTRKGFDNCRAAWGNRDWKTAAAELKDSAWYRQIGHIRGDRIANYLLTGCYPPSVAASSLFVSSQSGFLPGSVSLAT